MRGLEGRKIMTRSTIDRILEWIEQTPSIDVFDLTGGAPEMNSDFRYFVLKVRSLRPNATLIDRCNLTILLEPGYESLGSSSRIGVEPCLQSDWTCTASGPEGAGIGLQKGSKRILRDRLRPPFYDHEYANRTLSESVEARRARTGLPTASRREF